MNKQVDTLVDVELDGEAKISGLLRPPIKMAQLATTPQIVICMPVGGKEGGQVLNCPDCKEHWYSPSFRAPNVVPVELMLRIQQMQPVLNGTTAMLAESGRLSGEARQIMTKQAIRMGARYILYWDDDVIPPPMAIYEMHNWMERHPEAGAISGAYVTREQPCEPLVYRKHGEGAWWNFSMGEGAEPEQCFAFGAGFVLARVEAIQETIAGMQRDNGGEELPIWADGKTTKVQDGQDEVPDITRRDITWGHDIRFCKLLQDYGWPVYVDGRQLLGHIDVATGAMFTMPSDAPGFSKQIKKNINTKAYWDGIYGEEGANTWRQYPEMFEKVLKELGGRRDGDAVVELGCGVGILGSQIVGRYPVHYIGYDISPQAVAYAQARGLNAFEFRVQDLPDEALSCEVVVATEVFEHLDEADFFELMDKIDEVGVEKIIFTVPDNCMGPDEVPEHTALFNEELVRERMARYADWTLRIDKADEHHLICVMER